MAGHSRAPRRGLENNGERDESAQDESVAMGPGERVPVDGEPQARVTVEQGLERDPGFETGQGRAEAVVNAVAETEVRSVAAAEIEDVRLAEAAGIAVGRAEA